MLPHKHNTTDITYWLFIQQRSTFLLFTSPKSLSQQTAVKNCYKIVTIIIVKKKVLGSYWGQSSISDVNTKLEYKIKQNNTRKIKQQVAVKLLAGSVLQCSIRHSK